MTHVIILAFLFLPVLFTFITIINTETPRGCESTPEPSNCATWYQQETDGVYPATMIRKRQWNFQAKPDLLMGPLTFSHMYTMHSDGSHPHSPRLPITRQPLSSLQVPFHIHTYLLVLSPNGLTRGTALVTATPTSQNLSVTTSSEGMGQTLWFPLSPIHGSLLAVTSETQFSNGRELRVIFCFRVC